MTKRTVLVTGGAGLIGHNVQKLLEKRGDQVIAIDKFESSIEGRKIVECDLVDANSLHRMVLTHRIDSIVHCGAVSGPMVARDRPPTIVQTNLVGTANILELARIHGLRRVVICSSVTAYGSTQSGPVPEDVPLNPTSVYGASKAACEHLMYGYFRQHGVDAVALRLSWVYGPRRQTECLIRDMLLDALQEKPTRLAWGADFYRQYIYVEDAAASLVLALDAQELKRRTYSITGGSYLTLGQVAEIVCQLVPRADIEVLPGHDPEDDVQGVFDISAAQRDLGYSPQISIEQGIRKYLDWLIDRQIQRN
jgi:nucleoside-diphosphate-sugar epimerase